MTYLTYPSTPKEQGRIQQQTTMKLSLSSLLVFATPLLAQTVTPPPAPTKTNDNWGPPWASNDPGKWSSIYNSLVSDGIIPSTLTVAPWPTSGWGPGSGPWGPGWGPGGRGPGGPGGPGGSGHWGGTLTISFLSFTQTHFPQALTVPAPSGPTHPPGPQAPSPTPRG